jgi:hypothetical protein
VSFDSAVVITVLVISLVGTVVVLLGSGDVE